MMRNLLNTLYQRWFIILSFFCILYSCSSRKSVTLNQVDVNAERSKVRARYNPSKTIYFKLLHTKLQVTPLWKTKQLKGVATLKIRPYFYSQTKVKLDAKSMNINNVFLEEKGKKTTLKYDYTDSLNLTVYLPRAYESNEEFNLIIDYIANPEQVKQKGSEAIREAKGLYFINADNTDTLKMQQLWTQGETEASSCWFPTFEQSNQKCTQEIEITVDRRFTTISNGKLVKQENGLNNTRTDYWKMDLPHSPYLFMMAIGEFKAQKDSWKGIDLNYWTDDYYHANAKKVFGETPKMLTFFSETFGVDYPWQKYDQVVVHDFISGAMENTTAIIHGEFVARTNKELIDGNTYEFVIAHELVHHWFGDLVTCESWANLPLNESFADYGESLWEEHKYGKTQADYIADKHLSNYLRASKKKKVDMIRFGYKNKESMFDANSYAKGGRILHMLRKYVGDKAFFAAIKLYLEENKFKSTEMHQLRIAFEKTTGEDLNWFFNQWFYDKGHPKLTITYDYDIENKIQHLYVSQNQDYKQFPIYKLPLKVGLHFGNEVVIKKITIDSIKQHFSFPVEKEPDFVNFDEEKILVCEKTDKHTLKQWEFLYTHSLNYIDKKEALRFMFNNHPESKVILRDIENQFHGIKSYVIRNLGKLIKAQHKGLDSLLIYLIQNDSLSTIRSRAVSTLVKYYKENDNVLPLIQEQLTADSSLLVINACLKGINKINDSIALKTAASLEGVYNSSGILTTIGNIYVKNKAPNKYLFFPDAFQRIKKPSSKISLIDVWTTYILLSDNDTVKQVEFEVLLSCYKHFSRNWQKEHLLSKLFDIQQSIENKELSEGLKKKLVVIVEKENSEFLKNNLESYIK